MPQPLKVLLAEDNLNDAALTIAGLERAGFDPKWRRVDNEKDFKDSLKEGFDLVLSDYQMPQFDALRALELLKQSGRDIPFIIISGTIGEETAVEAIKRGTADYLLKDRLGRLGQAVKTVLEQARLRRERKLAETLHTEARHRAEQALRSSEERFRQLAENVQEVFWMTNPDKTEVLYVSPAYATIWGRTCESLYQDPATWRDSIHPEDGERVHRATQEQSGRPSCEVSYRILRPDGSVRWIRDRSYPVRDPKGRIYRMVGTAEDITETKKLQEQFLRSQRLEGIGLLAAGIAHDLNNVLAPILMVAPLLQEKMVDANDRRLLATVEKSAQRGASLIRQILGFAQGVGGEPTTVQVKHLLHDVASIIRETFPKSIKLETLVPNSLWTVTGNPTQIHQVLLNLCVNARDAMPAGGTLRLRGENRLLDDRGALAIEGTHPGPYLVLRVEDTGSGIPADILPRIWEPFFTTKATNKGTGLGLSTVRGIVETHQGVITVATSAGRGTTFEVYLPAAGEAVGSAGPAAPAPRGDGELILVVDDEDSIRTMSATVLSHHGYRVLSAADGVEALGLFTARQAEIAAVVTDMAMPHMGGGALIDVLRRMNPQIKMLAVSGASPEQAGPKETSQSANAFLPKPFSGEALLTEIHRLIHPPGS